MKNNLIIISGPAASGKTTLIKELSKLYNAKYFRPSDSYLELAKQKKIPLVSAFYKITRDEAEMYFCHVCKQHSWVIGDQHLAIQFARDSQMATSNIVVEDNGEEYSPSISTAFIDNLRKDGINVLLILLKADPQILFERANRRFSEIGHPIRNKSAKEVKKEIEAELYYFDQLTRETGVENLVIDTSSSSEHEIFIRALEKISDFEKKSQALL